MAIVPDNGIHESHPSKQTRQSMAAGRDHDRATVLAAFPFAVLIGLTLGPKVAVSAALAFWFGGLWLSPDLDTHCRALQRWGPLQLIWWPYRRLIPHRSIWSHGPLLGTFTRLLLLSGWIALALVLIPGMSLIDALTTIEPWCRSNTVQILGALLGLEASCWLHLILDGDPLPTEWQRRRRR